MDRRSFLKQGSLLLSTGATSLAIATKALANTIDIRADNYTKFLNPQAKLSELTEGAKKMVSRDQLLEAVLNKIPTSERVEQIFDVVSRHIQAEEKGDVGATMATLDESPLFESLPEGKVFRGHESVADDYAKRYEGLTRKLHITNLAVDASGAYAEMLWEGRQKGTYKELKPVRNAKSFFIPMVVYYEVTEKGLIKRESVYYDQYLGALSLEILPDILQSKLAMLALNPRLMMRKASQ